MLVVVLLNLESVVVDAVWRQWMAGSRKLAGVGRISSSSEGGLMCCARENMLSHENEPMEFPGKA